MTNDLRFDQESKVSRAIPSSLGIFARYLYETGKSREEVIREIYHIDFPLELYIFQKCCLLGPLSLPLQTLHNPWNLIVPLDQGGPSLQISSWSEEMERRTFAQAPQIVLLMELFADAAVYDDYFIGYDLEALKGGKIVVVGHEGNVPKSGAKFEVLGSSIIEILHEWISDHHSMVQKQYSSPSNRGAGSIDKEEVSNVAKQLRGVEAMFAEVRS